ncbi:sigma-54 interaction domain-containing protein [Bradyrhizobium sp. HKCCYLS20291]|uniref:sigma-54 interaction domain-containing protein n=1 Tax=Bradyrhizobium sp. HKCCYLS20291 TaxID=3420766 RepID=UPI003EBE035D
MDTRHWQSPDSNASALPRVNLLGQSPIFIETMRLIKKMAACDATVLVQGETGTGKELAARALHYLSDRRDFPFIPVNCGALPDNLLESELFGHERGAFTDAKRSSPGLVAQAERGTLFLDEVEAMTVRAQVVLLRFLEDRQYRPVGGHRISSGDVRIIASSNVDLNDMVRMGQFRRDLLFRFSILSLTMPPLRQRDNDAVLLAEHFVRRFATQYKKPIKRLHPETVDWMRLYSWPGNVRELQNLMLRECLLVDRDTIQLSGGADVDAQQPASSGDYSAQTFKSAKAQAMIQFERTYLSRLLTQTGGNITRAARIAGTDRSALNKLVKKHGLIGAQFRASATSV